VLEVSSQAISDARVADVAVGIAVCTTIGVDHLDVHGSEARYRAVKRSLFEGLGPDGVAVFHGDDAAVVEVAAGTGAIDIPVGRSPGSVVRITDDALHFGPEFARLTGRPQAEVPITNPLLRAPRADQRCVGRDGCAGRRGKPGGRRGWACRLRGTASSTPGGDPSSVHARR
jgi:UDP-N-acetylmuramoyl-L-alanyl-D-glutamate--2,6-diaminopimelate ligase